MELFDQRYASLPKAPQCCQNCIWWQSTGASLGERREWALSLEEGWGAFGKIGEASGKPPVQIQFAPAGTLPRAATLPGGPPSSDAVLLCCSYGALSDPLLHKALVVSALYDLKGRGEHAVEAFVLLPTSPETRDRSPSHVLFPYRLLAELGFSVHRRQGSVALMRLLLDSLEVAPKPQWQLLVSKARRMARKVAMPAPAAPSRPLLP